MRRLLTALLFCTLFIVAAGNKSCDWIGGRVEGHDFRFMISPVHFRGVGMPGIPLSDLGISLPFGSALPQSVANNKNISAIYMDAIAIRNTTPEDYDEDGNPIQSRLIDGRYLNRPCSLDEQPLDFIDSLKLFARKEEANSPEFLLAQYERGDQVGMCSIVLEIQTDPDTEMPYNLKTFLPDLFIRTEVTGTKPVNDLDIGGFISISFLAPHASPFSL